MKSPSHAVRWLRGVLFGRVEPRIGGTEVADAKLLADAERTAALSPDGCAWLDERTIDDVDLPLVFRAVDRTSTPTGAQVLWRWLTAPATDHLLLRARERKLAHFECASFRDRVTTELGTAAALDAPFLPRLLWQPRDAEPPATIALAVASTLLASALLAIWWPAFLICAITVGVVAMMMDDRLQQQLAQQRYAVEVLGTALERAAGVVERCALPEALLGDIEADLEVRAQLRRRIGLLTAHDPLGFLELLRAAFLVRLFVLRSCTRIIDAERARLRRIVLWLGELDTLCSIARLRAERSDAVQPDLVDDPTELVARALVHPVLPHGIGNDVRLAPGLLVTGSNMSGKSTLLRSVAVNAILAQSIHTTFGGWRAPLVRVRAVMRIRDDLDTGMSTYAVEVAAIGELVAAASAPSPPAGASPAGSIPGRLPTLFVLDEPFHGTNPAVRVPIVVAVFEHLAMHGLVIGATHDLDVASLLGGSFERAYFQEQPDGTFDRTLRTGIAESTNAVELLARAGYPPELLARVAKTSDRRSAGSRA
jgi:hypothetical protein